MAVGCSNRRPPSAFCRLAFAELEPLACLRTARLLALDGACVAREQSEIPQRGAMRLIHLDERAGDRETERTGLSGGAATVDVRLYVEAAERVGRGERLLNRGDERGTREIIAERASIDVPLARTGHDVHAADGFLAAADRVDRRVGLVTSPLSSRRSARWASARRA